MGDAINSGSDSDCKLANEVSKNNLGEEKICENETVEGKENCVASEIMEKQRTNCNQNNKSDDNSTTNCSNDSDSSLVVTFDPSSMTNSDKQEDSSETEDVWELDSKSTTIGMCEDRADSDSESEEDTSSDDEVSDEEHCCGGDKKQNCTKCDIPEKSDTAAADETQTYPPIDFGFSSAVDENELLNSVGSSSSTVSPVGVLNKSKSSLRSNLKRLLSDADGSSEPTPKKKKTISFDGVTVYYFPRAQGFTCVPSQGGSTLGMACQHMDIDRFSLVEHTSEQKKLHKKILQRMRNKRVLSTAPGSPLPMGNNNNHGGSSSEESGRDTEEEDNSDGSENMELDNYYFLQPVPTRQRRAMLRASGIRKIDSFEKDECRSIRTSREFCGCSCKVYCDPDTCSCAQAGIKCQVDRLHFPCGCTRDGCANMNGRIEFNPIRVRTHFIHTLMKLELEKKHTEHKEVQGSCSSQLEWLSANGPSVPGVPSIAAQPSASPIMFFEANPLKEGEPTTELGEQKFNGSLLRDLSFNTSMEVESCVNSGSYTHIHPDNRLRIDMMEPATTIPPATNVTDNMVSTAPNNNLCGGSVFAPGELQNREDSLDLYTAFQDDSYSENSDEISNDSFENNRGGTVSQPFQDQPPVTLTTPPEPQFNNGFGFTNGIRPEPFINNQCNFPTFQPPTTYPNQTNEAYDSPSYNSLKLCPTNPQYDFTMTYSQPQPPFESLYKNTEFHINGQYNLNNCYSNGNDARNQEPTFNGNNHETQKYTNLNNITSYTKLEPFSEILQNKYSTCFPDNGSVVYDDNGSELQESKSQISEDTGSVEESKSTESSGEDSIGDNASTENFGEIIKKSMVETVSA